MRDDPRLDEAKAMPIQEIADRLGIAGLKRHGVELVGPCPVCGGVDRFAINPRKNVYLCRHCSAGDGVALVQLVQGCDFKTALQWLCGDAPASIDPAEVERRRKRAQDAADKREAESKKYRRWSRNHAVKTWKHAVPAQGTTGYLYLRNRLVDVPMLPPCFRFISDHPYIKKINGKSQVLHKGPALIAAIQGPDNYLSAIHQTYIDLEQPKGKAIICLPNGDQLNSKLVRGSKNHGAIRLITPKGATTMVMGEGIETTLSAAIAQAVPDAAYWAGIDLGHMAGRQVKVDGKRHSGIPKMDDADDDGFVPPRWVKHLIFIQDGDSDPKDTRAKLEAGLRRAMARVPGLTGEIVHAGAGVDLNDVLMGAAHG